MYTLIKRYMHRQTVGLTYLVFGSCTELSVCIYASSCGMDRFCSKVPREPTKDFMLLEMCPIKTEYGSNLHFTKEIDGKMVN